MRSCCWTSSARPTTCLSGVQSMTTGPSLRLKAYGCAMPVLAPTSHGVCEDGLLHSSLRDTISSSLSGDDDRSMQRLRAAAVSDGDTITACAGSQMLSWEE